MVRLYEIEQGRLGVWKVVRKMKDGSVKNIRGNYGEVKDGLFYFYKGDTIEDKTRHIASVLDLRPDEIVIYNTEDEEPDVMYDDEVDEGIMNVLNGGKRPVRRSVNLSQQHGNDGVSIRHTKPIDVSGKNKRKKNKKSTKKDK